MEGEFPVCPEPRVKGGGWDRCGVRGRGGGGRMAGGRATPLGGLSTAPGVQAPFSTGIRKPPPLPGV